MEKLTLDRRQWIYLAVGAPTGWSAPVATRQTRPETNDLEVARRRISQALEHIRKVPLTPEHQPAFIFKP